MANINGDAANNVIFGDQGDGLSPTGADFVGQENTADQLFGAGGNDTIYALGGSDPNINGGSGDDVVSGGPGDDFVRGGRDNDTVIGGTGNDIVTGDRDNDLLFGLDDNDSLLGGLQDDTILGGVGSDTLRGEENSDQLFGGDGDDWLDGGRLSADAISNVDSLTGGGGSDVFALRPHDSIAPAPAHALTITDYMDNIDKLSILIDPVDTQVQADGTLRMPPGPAAVDLDFEDLTFTQIGADTQITFVDFAANTQTLATLENVTAANITAADFVDFTPGSD